MTKLEEYERETEQIKEWIREEIREHYIYPFTREDIMLRVLHKHDITILEELADEVLDEMCKSKEYIQNEDGTYIMDENVYLDKLVAARKKAAKEAKKAKKAAHADAEDPVI